MNFDIFSNQILLIHYVLVYKNHGNNAKRFNARKYFLPKGIIKIITSSSMEKKYDQPIDSDIKRYEETKRTR